MERQRDMKSFGTAIAALALTFDKEVTDVMLEAYWIGLCDLTISQVETAVSAGIRQCVFMPKPVELRRYAGEQTHEQRAIDAWNDVLKAIPLGPYKHVDFEDKFINASIRNLGGWPCFISRFDGPESEKWLRLEFLKTYGAMSSHEVSGELCLPLAGLSQQTAIGGVVQAPRPVLIGCANAARLTSSTTSQAPRLLQGVQ